MDRKTKYIMAMSALFIIAVFAVMSYAGKVSMLEKSMPNGVCRFSIYDRSYVGVRIKVYNMTLPKGSEWSDDCSALKALCERQGSNSSKYYTTSFECEWNDKDNECECLAYPKNETIAGGVRDMIRKEAPA